MAILDAVKNQIQGQVAARANSTIRSGLTKVAGNLLGINTQFSGPQLGQHNKRAPEYIKTTQYDDTRFAYPIDVAEDTRQGHYILFTVLEYDKAELEIAEKIGRAEFNHKELQRELGVMEEGIDSENQDRANFGFPPASAAEMKGRALDKLGITDLPSLEELDSNKMALKVITSSQHKTASSSNPNSSSLRLQNEVRPYPKSFISLYMPPSVQVSYGADYQDSEIGVFADVGAGAIMAFREGDNWRKIVETAVDKLDVGIQKGLLATLDTVAPGSKAVAQIITGKAITPKMELMFNGIGRREFSYEFTFLPRSPEEGKMVGNIVNEFKRRVG